MKLMNKEKEYKNDGKNIYSCEYFVCFLTKYKRKFLTPEIREALIEDFKQTALKYNFEVSDIDITGNQVKLIVSCDPLTGVNFCVVKLKNCSAGFLKRDYPELKKKVPSIWTRRNLISTMGVVDDSVIADFVSKQSIYQ